MLSLDNTTGNNQLHGSISNLQLDKPSHDEDDDIPVDVTKEVSHSLEVMANDSKDCDNMLSKLETLV